MQRKTLKPYLILIVLLLILLSISSITSHKLRGSAVAMIAPLWEVIATKIPQEKAHGDLYRLQLENQQLKNEVAQMQKIVQEERILIDKLNSLPPETLVSIKPMIEQHINELEQQIAIKLTEVPARVIFRSPFSWGSSLWLNVGKDHNTSLERVVVAKNSPVLMGNALVGVIDYVGLHQSRVRLITDSGLTPSVRAVRQKKESLEDASLLHLAKGELHGSSQPLWRTHKEVLKGTGFNYDFPDEFGPAHDLRSGAPLNASSTQNAIPLVQVNDLLVTTGYDGVFPAGLLVAKVTKIYPLKEGDYYYELEATPVVGDMDSLTVVYVIPPLGYDEHDEAPLIAQ